MGYGGVWVSIGILVVCVMLFGTTYISICDFNVILIVTIGLHLYLYYCWFYYLNRTFTRIWYRTFLLVDKCLSVIALFVCTGALYVSVCSESNKQITYTTFLIIFFCTIDLLVLICVLNNYTSHQNRHCYNVILHFSLFLAFEPFHVLKSINCTFHSPEATVVNMPSTSFTYHEHEITFLRNSHPINYNILHVVYYNIIWLYFKLISH